MEKYTVLGVKVLRGEKDGHSWDMSSVMIQTPIESFQNQKVTVLGYGFEIAEMPLDPACIHQFKDVKFPALIELEFFQRPRMGKFESVVVGLKGAPALVRTA